MIAVIGTASTTTATAAIVIRRRTRWWWTVVVGSRRWAAVHWRWRSAVHWKAFGWRRWHFIVRVHDDDVLVVLAEMRRDIT